MSEEPSQSPDPLDELLQQASWPDPSPAALNRLERTWDAISPARRRNLRPIAAAAAAVVLIAIWLGRSPAPRTVSVVVIQPQPHRVEVVMPVVFAPRAPNALELAAIQAESARPPVLPAKNAVAVIDEALLESLRDPHGDLSVLAADLQRRVKPQILQVELRRQISDARNPARASAIRLLGMVGSPQSLSFLLPLLQEPKVSPAAMQAISQLADISTIARLIPSAKDDAEKSQLIAAMLRRNPAAAMSQFLRLVENDQTRQAALQSLDELDHPPMRELMAALSAANVADRIAAARALGHIDGPKTTAELVSRIDKNISRRECLAALILSRGKEAKTAVAEARQSPLLEPLVRALQSELQPVALTSPNSFRKIR